MLLLLLLLLLACKDSVKVDIAALRVTEEVRDFIIYNQLLVDEGPKSLAQWRVKGTL